MIKKAKYERKKSMETAKFTHDLAVVIGRMQIPHIGHASLLEAAGKLAPKVLVVLGSAFQSRDPRNPFTWEERRAMVSLSVDDDLRRRLVFAPMQDLFDDLAWVKGVKNEVSMQMYGNLSVFSAHDVDRVVLVAHRKDDTSDYVNCFPCFGKFEVPLVHDVHATDLRNAYFSPAYARGVVSPVHQFVSQGVADYLLSWSATPQYQQRATEHQAVLDYKARWSPIGNEAHFTADAMIVCAGHVLMQQRGGVIGHGLWGLPGGFRNVGEDPFLAALRELEEETGLVLTIEQIEKCFVQSQVFGHPLRSPRGRILTEAFFFDLGDIAFPAVVPAVDQDGHQEAMAVRWIPIEELTLMREELFEDHGMIISKLFQAQAKAMSYSR